MTTGVRELLRATGLLPAARRASRVYRLYWDPAVRARRDEIREFEDRFGDAFRIDLHPAGCEERRALVIGPRWPAMEVQFALIKSLERAGFTSHVLINAPDPGQLYRPYYALAGVTSVHYEDDLAEERPGGLDADAREVLDRLRAAETLEAIATLEFRGVRVGKIALSSAIHAQRVGSLDPAGRDDRATIERRVTASIEATLRAARILDDIRPELVLFGGPEYSPIAELFDLSIGRGVDSIVYDVGHRSSVLMFKRYTRANRDDHVVSLSAATWDAVKDMQVTSDVRASVNTQLGGSYEAGDWYGACWTQANTRRVQVEQLRQELGLDPSKKTAVIFAHILWDAPLSWSEPLFLTYEEWLTVTLEEACRNDRLNWVIKIHPANIGKQLNDGFKAEPAELAVVRNQVGELPPHVKLLPPDTEVSTASVFDITDYCLTVRGTVGIEAARLGIPVVTAARSRYSHRGFTLDPGSPAEFRHTLRTLDSVPKVSPEARNAAERFAWGLFVLRPFVMKSVTWRYGELGRKPETKLNVGEASEWSAAPDLATLAEWLGQSQDEDFTGLRNAVAHSG